MFFINKYLLSISFSLVLVFFSISRGFCQTIEVLESTQTVKERPVKGHLVCIELDGKMLEKEWTRFLKGFGKIENHDRQTLEGLNLLIPTLSADALDLYSHITITSRCVQIFLGGFRAGSSLEVTETAHSNLKKLLYDFALEQYRNDFKQQIGEAERVVSLAVKAHDKRRNEGINLQNKLSKNRKNRVQLIQELEENTQNLQKLKSDSSQNFTEQETALEEIKKVRTIAEEKKQKLNQVK